MVSGIGQDRRLAAGRRRSAERVTKGVEHEDTVLREAPIPARASLTARSAGVERETGRQSGARRGLRSGTVQPQPGEGSRAPVEEGLEPAGEQGLKLFSAVDGDDVLPLIRLAHTLLMARRFSAVWFPRGTM